MDPQRGRRDGEGGLPTTSTGHLLAGPGGWGKGAGPGQWSRERDARERQQLKAGSKAPNTSENLFAKLSLSGWLLEKSKNEDPQVTVAKAKSLQLRGCCCVSYF